MKTLYHHTILIVRRLSRWALVWSDDEDMRTICSFNNEFQAYQMRRYLESISVQ